MLQCPPFNVNPLEPFVSLLPVASVLPELLHALRQAPQVLLNAPTGAGKSTWLPLQILREGGIDGRILLLEPRRLAARNVFTQIKSPFCVWVNSHVWGYLRLVFSDVEYHTVSPGVAQPVIAPVLGQCRVKVSPSGVMTSARKRL